MHHSVALNALYDSDAYFSSSKTLIVHLSAASAQFVLRNTRYIQISFPRVLYIERNLNGITSLTNVSKNVFFNTRVRNTTPSVANIFIESNAEKLFDTRTRMLHFIRECLREISNILTTRRVNRACTFFQNRPRIP